MTIKHNQQIPNNHFRKDWQRRVRCHFDQPGRKLRRRKTRAVKAAAVAPRPVDKLRPVVRCPTIKYNRKLRPGRGFTLVELKEAGIPRKFAPTVGIAVDPRRVNLSTESLTANVARLKAYRERLVVFPRKAGAHKKGDSSKEEIRAVLEDPAGNLLPSRGTSGQAGQSGLLVPVVNEAERAAVSEVKRGDMPKGEEGGAYKRLRLARSDARLIGVREKRAKAKAEEAAAKTK